MRSTTVALFVILAGCGGQSAPNEPTYREHLQVTAKTAQGKLFVLIKSSFGKNLHEQYELWAIDKSKKEFKTTDDMTESMKRDNSIAMTVSGLDVTTISQVRVRYEVWQGPPETRTHLFTGEKVADVTR